MLNAVYENGKLTEMSVYFWGKAAGDKAVPDNVLEAKREELVAAFQEKYGPAVIKEE